MNNYLFAISSYQKSANNFQYEACQRLHDEGHTVVLICDQHAGSIGRDEFNFPILDWPSKRPTKFRDFIFLYKIIREYRINKIVSAFGAVNVTMIVSFLLGVTDRIMWIRTTTKQLKTDIRSGLISLIKFKLNTLRKKMVMSLATKILANSNAIKADYIKFYKIKPEKIVVQPLMIYDGFKEKNEQLIVSNKEKKIVVAGRFSKSKGQDVLVRASAIITEKFPDYRFIYLGDGEYLNSCKVLADELNVSHINIFKGSVSLDNVMKEFETATLAVSTSFYEAFGLVNVEANSACTPVIGTNTEGIKEVIKDGVNGYLYEPGDYIKLANVIIELLSDENKLCELQFSSRELFIDKYSLNNINEFISRL